MVWPPGKADIERSCHSSDEKNSAENNSLFQDSRFREANKSFVVKISGTPGAGY